MVCASVREGSECIFMSKRGCQFNGGSCQPIVDHCDGCQRIIEIPAGKYWISFPDPAMKWKAGVCNMATHMQISNKTGNNKVSPLKASKRSH